MSSVDALLFDLGNVLLFHDNALLFRELGRHAGMDGEEARRRLEETPLWTDANRGTFDSKSLRAGLRKALGLKLDDDSLDALWSSHFTPNPEIFPVLEQLARERPLVLVSNTNPLHVEWFKPRLPVLERFRSLVLSCEVGLVKPEPAIYEVALKRAGVPAHRAAFFDDVQAYVDAASALGIHGRLFTNVATLRIDLAQLGVRLAE